MKATVLSWGGLVVVILLPLLGCAPPASPDVTVSTRDVTPPATTPTQTLWPTFTPRPPHAPTSAPTAAPLPTRAPTPVPTPTPALTPSPTPFATLEPDEMEALIRRMLTDDGGCDLPCWWGVVPGETGWEEMLQAFGEWGIDARKGYLDLADRNEEGDRKNLIGVGFSEKDGLVEGARINSDSSAPFAEDFAEVWGRYALQPVLARYGAPTQVYLTLTVGQPCLGSGVFPEYEMWVVYEDHGIAIRYPGWLLHDAGSWLACPVFGQVEAIEIRLQSPMADAPLVEIDPEEVSDDFVLRGTLPDLAGMGVEAFHEAFSRPDPRVCVVVPDSRPWLDEEDEGRDEIALPPDPAPFTGEEEDGLLVDLLATNGGCELPCWWGITPGATSWQEAKHIFLSYGKRVASAATAKYEGEVPEGMATTHRIGLFGRHDPYPFDYVVEHQAYEGDGTVNLIGIRGHSLARFAASEPGGFLAEHFSVDWQRYALDQVLARFGKPSQVLLHYWREPDSFFSVGVMYEDRGILVEYMGIVPGESSQPGYLMERVAICPAQDELTDINLWLAAPGAGMVLPEVFTRFGGGYLTLLPFHSVPSLEEATGMSLDAFYQTFLNPDTRFCLEAGGELGDVYS